MAGRPVLRAIEALVKRHGGDEWVWEALLRNDPETGRPLSVRAFMDRTFGASCPMFYIWLKGREGRQERWNEIRRARAEGLAEEGLAIVDELAPSEGRVVYPAEVAAARTRAEYRQWLAAQYDKEGFGRGPGGQTQVTIESLHLEALLKVGSRPVLEGPVVEAEVVE